jgi:L-iditol 2-dehydrogenase
MMAPMRTLLLYGAGDVRLTDAPDPIPGPEDELVRITAVGLCGSDLHWYQDGAVGGLHMRGPFVPGHEMGGTIVAGPRAGLRVAIEPADPCERCALCVKGHTNLCENTRFAGTPGTDGALAELMAWPRRLLVPVPDAIADDEVPLLESLGVALHSVSLGKIGARAHVAVVGAGPIGLLIVAVLRLRGVGRIMVSEPLAHRRAAALALGADEVIAPDPDGLARAAFGERADVAIEAAGTDAGIASACGMVAPGTRVVLAGIPGGEAYVLPAGMARQKGLTFPVARRMQAAHLAQAANLVASGAVPLGSLVTGAYPMAEGVAAFQALLRRDGLKLVIRPNA